MNESGNIQNIQDGLFINMDLFNENIQNSDESGLFFSLMAKTMEQQSDVDDGFFFESPEEAAETESMPRDFMEAMPVPIQLYDIEQQKIAEDATIDPQDRHNTLAWIDFAMKTEAELLKTMVLNQTCVPVPGSEANNSYPKALPVQNAVPASSEPEQPVSPDYEDWHWVPVNEPSTNTPSPLSPGFSETKESEPHWNELADIKPHGMMLPDSVMPEKMSVTRNIPAFDLPVSMEKPEWNEQFKQQIIWMGNQGIQKAVIRLHPENLGHLEIDIQVHNEQTSLQIISQHESTKERLVHALPQLQEALLTQGVDLSEIHIETRQEMSDSQQRGRQETFAQADDSKKSLEKGSLTIHKTQDGLVDYFV